MTLHPCIGERIIRCFDSDIVTVDTLSECARYLKRLARLASLVLSLIVRAWCARHSCLY